MAVGAAAVTRQRIAFIRQPVERCATNPGLLHELKLPFDISIQAHEEQARPLARLWFIEASDPDDAMAICDLDLLTRPRIEALARICAPDMRAERTPQPLRILGSEQEV